MSDHRTHHVKAGDGVTIGGTVHGEGPALVFVQGMLGDGDLDWGAVVPHLAGRFTCHLPSWRGRGRSGAHPDLGFGRMVDDVVAYVASVERPAGLVGWSFGANLALIAAATSAAMPAVAAVGPVAMGLADQRTLAAFGEGLARTAGLAAGGDLTAAVRTVATGPFDEREVAAAEAAGYLAAVGPYVPGLLDLLGQWMGYDGPTIEDPAVLAAIAVPVLVVPADSVPVQRASAIHVASHVPGARLHEIPGAGHAAPLTHPAALAEALAGFF